MPIAPRPRLIALPAGAVILCLVLGLAVILPATVYDTLHVTDTTFMAMVSRWVLEGAVPGRDFNHFYGGGHEFFVALAYRLFGMSIKALDYALVLQFVFVLALLFGLAWRRLDQVSLSGLTVVLAIILFARLPFEELPQLVKLNAAHSFAYNRFGTALCVICAAAALVPAKGGGGPAALGAVIAALAAIVAVLAKATFFPIVIGVVGALALTGRWRELVIFALACVAFFLALDPSLQRVWGTLSYSLSSSGLGGGKGWLFDKAFRLVWAQQLQVLAFFILLVVLWLGANRARRLMLVATVLILSCFWATTVTMGPPGLTGHSSAPMMAALALLLWARSVRDKQAGTQLSAAGPLVALLCAALIVPHSLNILGTAAVSLRNAERAAFTQGPLAGYYARRGRLQDETGKPVILARQPDKAMAAAKRRLAEGKADASTDYVALYDGVRLLESLPGSAGYRLATDSRLGFSFALGMPRLEDFPVWVRGSSPELAEGKRPLDKAQLVLLDRTGASSYTSAVKAHMDDSFILCRSSDLWDLYSRKTLCPEPVITN